MTEEHSLSKCNGVIITILLKITVLYITLFFFFKLYQSILLSLSYFIKNLMNT